MGKLTKTALLLALGTLPFGLIGGGCVTAPPAQDGICTKDPAVDCAVTVDGVVNAQVGLVGYSCTGTFRPDEDGHYDGDVPLGLVCADKGPNADGHQTYCCSPDITTCSYDPALACEAGTSGLQCRGASRPEAFNAAIRCGNGIRDDVHVNYCCTGQAYPPSCTQTNAVGCTTDKLTGFACPRGVLPKGEDLGSSESRADYFRLLCPTPIQAPNINLQNYCCYMAAPPPPGFSCVQNTAVPGCAPGRFGFSCYGFDTPDQDYLPMHCPDPGFPGTSQEGYPATLYCCDFQ
jgi:hypothetical protein